MNILKKYPLYRKFILNNFMSTMGDSMYLIALMTYAAQFPQPAPAISLVTLSETIPGLFFIVTGSLADMSINRTKKTMINGIIRGILYFIVGIIIGFKPSMMILTGIVLLNFISDIIGKYSSGLMTPFVLFIVQREDIEEAQGLAGAITNLVGVVANFVGAFLMGLFSYQLLAWINSGVFFATVLVIYSMRVALVAIEQKYLEKASAKQELSLKGLAKQIFSSLKEIKHNQEVFTVILLFAVANGGLTLLAPLVSLFITTYPELVFKNFAFTLAVFQSLISLGVILGSLFGPRVLKNISLKRLCQGMFVDMVVVSIGMLLKSVWLILLTFAALGILIGSAAPKLNTLVISSFDVAKLGTINGGINTLLLLAPPVATAIFGLAAAVSLETAILFLASFSIVAFVRSFFKSHKKSVTIG